MSSAYRKLGVAGRAALVALLAGDGGSEIPEIRYATNDGAHLAYQVFGDGRRDVLFIPGFVSNVESAWTWPAHAAFLRRLTIGSRLIVFDKRGTGLSDPVADPSAHTLEQRMEDARAVLDAAGSRRAAVFGFSEGAAIAMLLAATYPARTNGLVLHGALISPRLAPSANPARDVFGDPAAWELMQRPWGTGRFLARAVPSIADDEEELAHVARFERHGASPASAHTIFRLAAEVELRSLCAVVRAPALVLHRRDDPFVPVAHGR